MWEAPRPRKTYHPPCDLKGLFFLCFYVFFFFFFFFFNLLNLLIWLRLYLWLWREGWYCWGFSFFFLPSSFLFFSLPLFSSFSFPDLSSFDFLKKKGEKYIYHGIFFKFAIGKAKLWNGNDENAAKQVKKKKRKKREKEKRERKKRKRKETRLEGKGKMFKESKYRLLQSSEI